MTTRRTILKVASWVAPTAIVAVSSPAIATSDATSDILVFTNVTATPGPKKNTIYANTRVMVTTGEAVPGLFVKIEVQDQEKVWEHDLGPWGTTPLLKVEFGDISKDESLDVKFSAWTEDGRTLFEKVTFTPPSWWN